MITIDTDPIPKMVINLEGLSVKKNEKQKGKEYGIIISHSEEDY